MVGTNGSLLDVLINLIQNKIYGPTEKSFKQYDPSAQYIQKQPNILQHIIKKFTELHRAMKFHVHWPILIFGIHWPVLIFLCTLAYIDFRCTLAYIDF